MMDITNIKAETKSTVLRALFENSREPVFIIDGASMKIIDSNDAAVEMYGYSKQEFLEMTPLDLSAEKDVSEKYIEEVRKGNFSTCVTRKQRKKDGTEILAEIYITTLSVDGNHVLIGQIRDVTARKIYENNMRGNAVLFHQIFDCHNGVMLIIDPSTGMIVRANKAASDFYGYTPEEFRTMNINQINQLAPEVVLEEMKAAKSEKRNKFIFPHKLANGEIRTVEVFSNPLTIDGKEFLYSFVNDITERKTAEERLIANELRLRAIIGASPVAMALNDEQRNITFLNTAFIKSFGYTLEDIPTLAHWWPAAYPDAVYREWVAGAWQAELQRAMESGEPFTPIEFNVRCKDGTVKTCLVSANPISESLASEHLVVLYDITERKKAEDIQQILQAQEKHAFVGKVAGKMAHDFNNILGIIMGTSELVLSGELPEDVRADIEIIKESAVKGRDLTQNLLLYAKDQEAKLTHFNINDKLNRILNSLKTSLKDIEVTLTHGAHMDDITADEGLLENALINMIQNSIHAMSKTEQPILSIKTSSDPDNIYMEINDNGCGIPADFKDKIYDPAVTLKGGFDKLGAYRRDIKGSGYGMANVKRCIEKHNGTISFDSEVGKGTSFKISIPIIKAQLNESEIKEIRKYHVAEKKRILIVEDEPHLGRILYSILGKFDHLADLATDGKMALDHIKNNTYDIISLDYVLPDMNGIEVYNEIRTADKNVPVVFVSGNFEFIQSMIHLKKDDSKVDFLAKPFGNVEYLNAINKFLTG